MSRVPSYAIITWGALHLACSGPVAQGLDGVGGSGGSSLAGSGGGSSGSGGVPVGGSAGTMSSPGGSSGSGPLDAGSSEPDAAVAEPARHLGKPFSIVNGYITAASNQYGFEGQLYVVSSPVGSTVTTTSLSGELCVNGTIDRVANGDFPSQWGMIFGFDAASPWALDNGVEGIAATVVGPIIPRHLLFSATTVEQTQGDYSNCDFSPPIVTSGQVARERFAELHTQCWDRSLRPGSAWPDEPVQGFGWGVGSDEIAGNPFNFCLSDIRPIVSGAGPDEPADVVADAGPESADAGVADGG